MTLTKFKVLNLSGGGRGTGEYTLPVNVYVDVPPLLAVYCRKRELEEFLFLSKLLFAN